MTTLTSSSPDMELVSWMKSHLGEVKDLLSQDGLVHFRGFDTRAEVTLKNTLGLFGLEPMTDARWSTPRTSVGEGVFTSTEYPADQRIVLHSEMSYSKIWPRLILFQCKTAAQTGGATTIADIKAASSALGDILSEFHERDVTYLRNFRKGLDIPWQNAFGTQDRDEVSEIGARNGLEIEWKPDGTLHTTQQAQGAIDGPDGPLWFNQAHLFHPYQLPTASRKALLSAFGANGLPRNATFGDGGQIPDITIRHVLEVLSKHTENIDWQDGDLTIIDNMRWMHGRSPFTGVRKVLAAMGQPQTATALTPLFN
jgi:hypothetical protein